MKYWRWIIKDIHFFIMLIINLGNGYFIIGSRIHKTWEVNTSVKYSNIFVNVFRQNHVVKYNCILLKLLAIYRQKVCLRFMKEILINILHDYLFYLAIQHQTFTVYIVHGKNKTQQISFSQWYPVSTVIERSNL